MADADEDAIPALSSQNTSDDLEDDTQDFRFLAQLTAASSGTAAAGQTQSTLPKRGIKDFEPNSTRSQATALDASREAMHVALSAVRIHSGKNHIVGQYLPDERNWRFGGRCVVVYKFKSTHARAMGQADSRNWVWFLPEEALYLLERGSLDIRWPGVIKDGEEDDKTPDGSHTETVQDLSRSSELPVTPSQDLPQPGELPMSLQGAYASFIGKSGLTLERYIVYAGLKRSGYIVQRAPTWDDQDVHTNGHPHPYTEAQPQNPSITTPATSSLQTTSHVATTILHRLFSWLFAPSRGEACPALGPFVAPGLYRNYNDIFRALTLIPYHQPDSTISSSSDSPPSRPPFTVSFHVHKPTTAYKKSSPPPPDYQIAVLDARSTHVPSMTEIGALLDTMPGDSLPKEKTPRLETRIKHGRRNVLLAIVDAGIVSYLRFSEAAFGADSLWQDREKMKSKTKWKGKRGSNSGGKGKGKGQKGSQGQKSSS